MFPNGMNAPLTSVGPRPDVPGSAPYAFGGPMAGNIGYPSVRAFPGGQLPAGVGGAVGPLGQYGGQLQGWGSAPGGFDIGGLVNSPQGQQFMAAHPNLQALYQRYQAGGFPQRPQAPTGAPGGFLGQYGGPGGVQQLLANRTPAGMSNTLTQLGNNFKGFG